MSQPVTLEVCVDSVESAIAAERGGAHRVELCSALGEGGVTPSAGLIAVVRQRIAIALHVMVRPRASDFCYSEEEFAVMERDLLMLKQLRVDGVVFGVLDENGRVDVARTKRLVELAAPLPVTFHRAFDMTSDFLQALEDVKASGARRILTSGGKQTAAEGAARLKQLVDAATGRIAIMAASGIEARNVSELLEKTGVREVHASLRSAVESRMSYRNDEVSMGLVKGMEYRRLVADEKKVREMMEELGKVGRQEGK